MCPGPDRLWGRRFSQRPVKKNRLRRTFERGEVLHDQLPAQPPFLGPSEFHPRKDQIGNYYLINGSFYLVDLPGYGFAKVRDEEKQKWSLLMEEFFSREKYVTLLGLLIDSQVGPTPFDENMLGAASLYKLPTLLIATKCDKLNNDEKKQRSRRWEGETGVPVLPYSSKSGEGRRELWQTIENILEDRNP